jgi:hypothetical protein
MRLGLHDAYMGLIQPECGRLRMGSTQLDI